MVHMQQRERLLRRASYISIAGNLGLALIKIGGGLVAGSLAVLGDGLDSLGDIAFSVMTLWVAVIISTPPDAEHPYGHSRAETIGASLLAFGMFFLGGQLLLATIHKLMEPGVLSQPEPLALHVTVISIIGKLSLSLNQRSLARKADSQLLMANATNMQNDSLTSAGVLLGLGLGYLCGLPWIDKLVALLLALWIMTSAIRIYLGVMHELMDSVRDGQIYERIFAVLKERFGDINPHRVRVRKLGAYYVIDLDIELDAGLSLEAAHQVACQVEQELTARIENIYDILVHVEPKGNVQESECFGRRAE